MYPTEATRNVMGGTPLVAVGVGVALMFPPGVCVAVGFGKLSPVVGAVVLPTPDL